MPAKVHLNILIQELYLLAYHSFYKMLKTDLKAKGNEVPLKDSAAAEALPVMQKSGTGRSIGRLCGPVCGLRHSEEKK